MSGTSTARLMTRWLLVAKRGSAIHSGAFIACASLARAAARPSRTPGSAEGSVHLPSAWRAASSTAQPARCSSSATRCPPMLKLMTADAISCVRGGQLQARPAGGRAGAPQSGVASLLRRRRLGIAEELVQQAIGGRVGIGGAALDFLDGQYDSTLDRTDRIRALLDERQPA